MKKTILAAIIALMVPMIASAQGTVSFSSSTANHRVSLDGTTPVGAGYSAALYWGTLGSPEGALVQLGATTGVNSTTGFLINGGVRTTGSGTAGGSSATFQVRAWNGGWTTFEQAIGNGAVTGKTPPFTNPTGDPLGTPPGTAAQLSGWTTPFLVPEPSTTALAGLGAAALLLFRRRK